MAKLASEAALCYNTSINIVVSKGAANTLRLANLCRRLAMDIIPHDTSLKKCHDCGRMLDVSEFIPRQKSRTTLTAACQTCRDKNTARINPERNRAKVRAWLAIPGNKESASQRINAWHRAHPESSTWRKKHPDLHRQSRRNAKARRKNALGYSTAEQVAARVAMWGGKCWMCGESWEQIDHVIPLSRGGTNWPANLRPACAECNNRKNGNDHRMYIQRSRLGTS